MLIVLFFGFFVCFCFELKRGDVGKMRGGAGKVRPVKIVSRRGIVNLGRAVCVWLARLSSSFGDKSSP